MEVLSKINVFSTEKNTSPLSQRDLQNIKRNKSQSEVLGSGDEINNKINDNQKAVIDYEQKNIDRLEALK